MLRPSMLALAVLAASSCLTAQAAESFKFENQTEEYSEALSEYRSISADASAVTFLKAVGAESAGTVSAVNESRLVFADGLKANTSGSGKYALSVAGRSTVEVRGSAALTASGYQGGAILVTDGGELRFVNAEKVDIGSSGAEGTALVADRGRIELVNSTVTLGSNPLVGISLQGSELAILDGSFLDTTRTKRRTAFTDSDVVVADGSSFATYALEGSGSLVAEGGSTVTLGGMLTVEGDVTLSDSTLSAKTSTLSKGALTVTGKSDFKSDELAMNDGTLALSGDAGQKVTIGSLSGKNLEYRLNGMGAEVSIGSSAVESLHLSGSGAVNDAAGGDVEKALGYFGFGGSGNAEGGELDLEEGMYQGATHAVFDEQNGIVSQTTQSNTLMEDALALASGSFLSLNRMLTNDLRQRMGDLRSASDASGAWVRWDGGRMSGEGLENDFHTIQVGIDTEPVPGNFRFGVAGSFTTADAEFRRGSADTDAFGLAAYGVWMTNAGWFADVVGRIATARTDMKVDADAEGKVDNNLVALSAEFGRRFELSKTLWAEPQFEAAFARTDGETIDLGKASYDVDAVESLTGRLGAAAGLDCPNGKGSLYLRASVVHEFLGDAAVTGANGTRLEKDGKDTWAEFGLGANYNLNESVYFWADLERTEGAALDEDWRATVGVRCGW